MFCWPWISFVAWAVAAAVARVRHPDPGAVVEIALSAGSDQQAASAPLDLNLVIRLPDGRR